MEVILMFIANAIASGAIGHYVSKGLGNIDKELPELFESNADIGTIEKLIEDKGIESQVIEFANNTFNNSIVLPVLTSETITSKDKVQLFLNFVEIGMELSFRLKVDLLLPSSFVSPNSFTLFADNRDGVPHLSAAGVAINLKSGAFDTISNKLCIVPVETDKEKEVIWNDYLDNLSSLREETDEYLKIDRLSSPISNQSRHCDIDKISAGSCSFDDAVLMDASKKELLNLKDEKVKSSYWYESIREMTHGMHEIMDKQVLTEAEVVKIREAYAHIQGVLDKHIN